MSTCNKGLISNCILRRFVGCSLPQTHTKHIVLVQRTPKVTQLVIKLHPYFVQVQNTDTSAKVTQ